MALSFSGQRLCMSRAAAGMRREALAVALDRSYSSVVAWETGQLVPSANLVGRIAQVIGCGVEDLFVDAAAGEVA